MSGTTPAGWSSSATSGTRRPRSTRPRPSWTRAGASGCASRSRSPACSGTPGWPRWTCGRSRCRPGSGTSTTTGARSSAARAPRRATPCPWTSPGGPRCGRSSAGACRPPPTGRSRWSPGPGQRAGCLDSASRSVYKHFLRRTICVESSRLIGLGPFGRCGTARVPPPVSLPPPDGTPGGGAMSPFLPSRPGGRVRLLVLGLLLAVAALLVAPAASAAPSGAQSADQVATADRVTRALGAQGAGAYLDASGRLTVNVLGARAAAQVRAAGATPKLVTRSSASLERVRAALDAAGTAPAVRTQPFYGGQAIYRGGSRCSAGFNTRSGSGRTYVLTAGHCTDLGGTWTTSSGQTIGPVAASSFPGNDFGAIRISSPAALDPRGGVLHYGAFRDITGAGRVPVGGSACKTGSTTGTTCGTVQAYNVTVRYAEGTVYGMTRTNICTQPGDSGGGLYARRPGPGTTPPRPTP